MSSNKILSLSVAPVDVLILLIESHGDFHRNMTPAEWRRAILAEKYIAATATNYIIGGFELYRKAVIVEDGNFQVTVNSAEDAIRIRCGSDEIKTQIQKHASIGGDIYSTLVNAVIIKNACGPSYNTILCNGIKLDAKLEHLLKDALPSVSEFLTRVQKRCVKCNNKVYTFGCMNLDCHLFGMTSLTTDEKVPKSARGTPESSLATAMENLVACRVCACGRTLAHPALNCVVCDGISHLEEPRFDLKTHRANIRAAVDEAMQDRVSVQQMSTFLLDVLSEVNHEAMKDMRMVPQMFSRTNHALDAFTDAVPRVNEALDSFVVTSATIQNAIPQLNEAARGVVSVSNRVSSLLDGWSGRIEDFSEKIGDFFGEGVSETLSDLLSMIADTVAGAYGPASSFGTVRWIFRTMNIFKIATSVVQGFLKGFGWCLEWLGRFLSQEPNLDSSARDIGIAQAGPDPRPLATLVTALVGTIMTGTLPSKEGMRYTTDMLRTFTYAVPAAGHVGDLVNYIIELLPVSIQHWLCFLCPSERLFVQLGVDSACKKWLLEVDEVLANPEAVLTDQDLQARVLLLDGEGRQLVMDLALKVAREYPDSKLFSILNRYLTRVEKAKAIVLAIQGSCGQRVTPFCFYLYGSPGVGKSSFARYVVDSVCPKDIKRDNRTYVRNAASSYWDGYHRQFAVVCDDFHQSIEAKDVEEMIQVLSNNTFFPAFASVDSPIVGIKGTAMNSKLVVLLSNESHPDTSTSIRTVEAFLRRRQMVVKMVPKREFAINPTESDPLRWRCMDEKRDAVNWSHVDFYLMDSMSSQAATVKLDVEQLLLLFMKNYESHMEREERLLKSHVEINVVDRVREKWDLSKIVPMVPEMFSASGARERAARVCEIIGDHASEEIKSAVDLLCDVTEQRESSSDFIKRITGSAPVVKEVDSISFDEVGYSRAVEELRGTKVSWLKKYPRVALALKIGAAIGIFGGALGLFFLLKKKKKAYVAESSPERVKFKRGVARQRVYVAESGKSLPIARKWIAKLQELVPGQDLVPLVDLVENCRENVETYNQALLDGIEPDQEWIDRIEAGMMRVHSALHALIPAWPDKMQFSLSKIGDAIPKTDVVVDIGEAEGCVDPQALSLESAIFLPSMVRISDGDMSVGGCMIRGSIGLFPRHFFSSFVKEYKEDGAPMSLSAADGSLPRHVRFDKNRYQPLYTKSGVLKDVCLYNFGPEIRSYKDICDHFMKENDLAIYSHFPGGLLTFGPMARYPCSRYTDVIKPMMGRGRYMDHEKTEYLMVEGWEYKIPTSPGDCGGLLVAHNTGLPRKLVGIHVSATPNASNAFSELVTCEQLSRAMEKFREVVTCQPIPGGLDSVSNTWLRELVGQSSTLTVLGTVPPLACPRSPERTSIRVSPLFDQVFKHVCEPSALVANDPRIRPEYRGESMLAKGVLAFGRSLPSPRLDYAEKAIAFVSAKIRAQLRDEPRFVCTEREAINGKHEFTHCGSMEMSSSPGYPYVLLRPLGTKGKFFLFDGPDGDKSVSNELLRANLDQREEMSRRLERPVSFWQALLKDELRPMDKIAIGKTRVFIAANVDLTMMTRKYTLAFTSAMFRHCNDADFFFAPGMDCFSWDWTNLMNSLLCVSDVGCGGDFSKYDTSLSAVFMSAVCDIMNDWFDDDPIFHDSEENKNVRRTLFHEFIHTMILVGNTVVYKHAGNNSGNPLTTLINCIVNKMCEAYTWQVVAPEESKDLIFYEANVRSKVFGDDIITAIKRPVAEFFNMSTISAAMKEELGMDYTDAEKTGKELVALRPLEELTFLKCGFKKVGKLWFPTLSFNSIQETTNWISDQVGGADPWVLCRENCSDALKYAFFHGAEYFNSVRDKIIYAARERGQHFVLPDIEFYATQFAKRGKMPSLAYHSCGTLTVYEELSLGIRPDQELVAQSGRVMSATGSLGDSAPEETMEETEHVGVVRVQQTETVQVTRVGETSADSHAMGGMKDFDWSMAKLVERLVLVVTGNWSVTDVWGVPLQTLDVPIGLLVNSVVHTPFSLYAFWRGDTDIVISVTGTKFVTGRLIAFFVPMTNDAFVAERYYVNQAAQTSVPHVFIDPADNTAAVLRVPFVNPKNFIDFRQVSNITDTLGRLVIMPFNILRVGAGQPTAVSYSVSVKFTNSTFAHPIPPEIARRAHLARQLTTVSEDPFEMVPQGAALTKISNTYNLNHSAMKTQGNTSASSELTAKVDASIPTLDYPNINLAPLVITRNPMGNFSNSTQIDHSERLNLQPGDGLELAIPETFGSTQDEMSFEFLKRVQNIEQVITWSVTNNAGALLYWSYMCPCSQILQGKFTRASVMAIVTLDWMSMKFSFWSGLLKVRLQMIASMYHTGKLFVSLMYGIANSPTTLTLTQVTAGRGVYFSLNDLQHDFEIDIDWASNVDMKRMPNGPNDASGPRTNIELLEFCLGTWSIWVVEPLRAAPGVPTIMDINIWKYAGDTYQVHHLGTNNASVVPYEGTVARRTAKDLGVAQAGKTDAVTSSSTAPAPGRPYNPVGEVINGVGDVIKRRVFVATVFNNPTNYNMLDIGQLLFEQPIRLSSGIGDNKYNGCAGLMRWFGSGYRAYRGSVRFRVQWLPFTDYYRGGVDYGCHVPDMGIAVGWDLYPSSGPNFNGILSNFVGVFDACTDQNFNSNTSNFLNIAPPMTYSDPGCNYVSVEVPYVSQFKFKLIAVDRTIEPETYIYSPGCLMIATPGSIGVANSSNASIPIAPGRCRVWVSAGDEFRFGIFTGPPLLYVLSTNFGADGYALAP